MSPVVATIATSICIRGVAAPPSAVIVKTLLLSAVLLTCLASGHLPAATYFVAQPAQGAFSIVAPDGSETKPWSTIPYALSRILGGDTLYVKSGIYQGVGVIIPASLSGTAANPTRIQAWPGDSVILCGDGPYAGQVKLAACSNLVLAGFIITNFSQGFALEAATDVTILNCAIQHVGLEGIAIRGNSRQVLVQGCSITHAGSGSDHAAAISIGSGPAGPLDNTSLITLRSNVIGNLVGSAVELQPGTHDCTVERNTISAVAAGRNRAAIEVHEATLGVQQWAANPNHVVNGNLLHDTGTAIRAGTGCRVVNNLIYNLTPGGSGILVDNPAGDTYPRQIYQNTIDAPATLAVSVSAGLADIRNNLGPSQTNNLPVTAAYFVNAVAHNYHLAPRSPPVDAGVDLSAIVPDDLEGTHRPHGKGVDLGAYERVPARPAPPGGLRIIHTGP